MGKMKRFRYLIIGLFLAGVFVAGCQKDCSVNVSVAVDAGNAQTTQLPADSVTLTGMVTAGLTANTTYLWTVVSGPSVPVFGHNDSSVTIVKNLVKGTYVLQLQATNNVGMTGLDTTRIVVTEPVIKTLTLQPDSSETEASPDSYFPTGNGHGIIQLSVNAWTRGGLPEDNRTYIKFDYSGIPSGATITSATLTLSANLKPLAGNYVDALFGFDNAANVMRVTSNWDIATINWDNQPLSTTQNAAVIPQSTSSFQTDVIDVTQLVKDMIVTDNYGFAVVLQNEVPYNSRQYASSFYPDPARRPKLEINYQ